MPMPLRWPPSSVHRWCTPPLTCSAANFTVDVRSRWDGTRKWGASLAWAPLGSLRDRSRGAGCPLCTLLCPWPTAASSALATSDGLACRPHGPCWQWFKSWSAACRPCARAVACAAACIRRTRRRRWKQIQEWCRQAAGLAAVPTTSRAAAALPPPAFRPPHALPCRANCPAVTEPGRRSRRGGAAAPAPPSAMPGRHVCGARRRLLGGRRQPQRRGSVRAGGGSSCSRCWHSTRCRQRQR